MPCFLISQSRSDMPMALSPGDPLPSLECSPPQRAEHIHTPSSAEKLRCLSRAALKRPGRGKEPSDTVSPAVFERTLEAEGKRA